MAVERLTPERRRQMTRDTLIDAATIVFARRGYNAASLDEIAEAAGFTRGAIYKNFTDKEDLFLAVWKRFNERMLSEFDSILADAKDFHDVKPAVVAEKWQEMTTSDPDFYVLGLEFLLFQLRNPEVLERFSARRHENTQRIAQYMSQQDAMLGVVVPIPAEDLANIFMITSDGFSIAGLTEPETARLYEPFLDLMMRGMVSLASEHAAASPPASRRAKAKTKTK